MIQPEDLFVERVLGSFYPQQNQIAHECAKKLAAVALGGGLDMNWDEVRRIAQLLEYRNLEECKAFLKNVANEIRTTSPLDSN